MRYATIETKAISQIEDMKLLVDAELKVADVRRIYLASVANIVKAIE